VININKKEVEKVKAKQICKNKIKAIKAINEKIVNNNLIVVNVVLALKKENKSQNPI